MVTQLYATFTLSRGSSDATDVPIGTLTGPYLKGDVEQLENSPNNTKYQFACTYIAGSDNALEYTIIRKTFTKGASVEVDTAYATIAGNSKDTFLRKVSEDALTVTYDIIVIHLNS